MREVESKGPDGTIRLWSRSYESRSGYQESNEREDLLVRNGQIVLRKSTSEGRVLQTQTPIPEYEYEINPYKIAELIKQHGTKRA